MKYVSHGLLLSWGLLTNRLIEKIKKKQTVPGSLLIHLQLQFACSDNTLLPLVGQHTHSCCQKDRTSEICF